MLRKSYAHLIILPIGIILVIGACTNNPQKSSRQAIAYDNCMRNEVKELRDKNTPDAKMVAHFICNMMTGYMDDRYFDCLTISTKMFSSDGVRNPKASGELVCKFYAQACKESPQNVACGKGYIADAFQNNPNASYPGTGMKKLESGSTLLIDLVSSGDVDTVEAVIKRGADVNESMGGNWTPLVQARSKGNQQMIEMLIRHDAQ